MQTIINFKQSLNAYLKIIDTRIKDGDYLGALDAGRRAIESAKTRVDRESINIILGQIYFEMRLYFLSCEHFFRAIKVAETRAGAFFGIGRNLVKMHNEKLALEYFNATLDTASTQDFSGAVLEWTFVIRENLRTQENGKSLFAIAKNLAKMGKYEQAISMLSPSFAKGDIDTKIFVADLLILSRDFTRAREILFSILRENPENVEANLVLCNLCLAENDLCSLEINLEKLENLQMDKNQYLLTANLYFSVGKWNKAINFYEKSLKLDEYNIKTMLFMAIAYYNLGEKQEALYTIGRARWVDIENPILNGYYDIFNRDLVPPPLRLITKLPKKIADNKMQNIFGAISSGNFCEILNTSITFVDDLDWCFTNKDNEITNRLANALSKCKRKKATKLYQKYLLSVRLDTEQKFYLTKHALLSQNLTEIDVTANLRYRSFKTKLPKKILQNCVWKEAYCNAVSYAEVNGIIVDFEKINNKIYKKIGLNNQKLLNERVFSCLYFCYNAQVLRQACIYFGVENDKVMQAINEFQLLV